jgi:dynein assembly factor with WDR repeat domains 1
MWDVGYGMCVETFVGHSDEVLDVKFNSTGTKLVTASSDSTARIYNVILLIVRLF